MVPKRVHPQANEFPEKTRHGPPAPALLFSPVTSCSAAAGTLPCGNPRLGRSPETCQDSELDPVAERRAPLPLWVQTGKQDREEGSLQTGDN